MLDPQRNPRAAVVRSSAVAAGLMFMAVSSAVAAPLVSLDFESGTAASNQFTQNFRDVGVGNAPGTKAQTDPADVGEPNNDYVYYERTTGGNTSNGAILIYDTTPANSLDADQVFTGPVTVSLDVAAVVDRSGIGIFLFDPANRNNNVGAYLEINNSGASEIVHWRRDSSLTAGTLGTSLGSPSGNYGVTISSHASPTFYGMSLTYTIGATSDTLSLTLGSNVINLTVSGTDRVGTTAVGVALRLNEGTTTGSTAVKFDNFQIIPEPASMAAMALGGAFVFVRRRRAVRGRFRG